MISSIASLPASFLLLKKYSYALHDLQIYCNISLILTYALSMHWLQMYGKSGGSQRQLLPVNLLILMSSKLIAAWVAWFASFSSSARLFVSASAFFVSSTSLSSVAIFCFVSIHNAPISPLKLCNIWSNWRGFSDLWKSFVSFVKKKYFHER